MGIFATMTGEATGPGGRLTRLDGLRGLAACGVALLYHAQALFTPETRAALPGLIRWFHHWGWTLVDLFFVISGFIFAHVYLLERAVANGGGQGVGQRAGQGVGQGVGQKARGFALQRGRLGDFAMARVARLYPLHLATLTVCAIAFAARPENTPLALLANLFMLQAFVGEVGHTYNGPSWSISVECLCYLVFALGAAGGPRLLRKVTIVALAGALVHFLVQGRAEGPWVGDCIPRGLLGFFLGVALWQVRARLRHASVPLLVCLLAIGLGLDMGAASPVLPLSLLAWPALMLLALRLKTMGSAPMRWLGDRSYAIYLVHWPLLGLIEARMAPVSGGLLAWATTTFAFAVLVLAVSDIVFRYLETPARRAIRDAWVRRRRRPGGLQVG